MFIWISCPLHVQKVLIVISEIMEGCIISACRADRHVVVSKIHVFIELAGVQAVSTQVSVHVQGSGGVNIGSNRT
jgi:hypothetical protein